LAYHFGNAIVFGVYYIVYNVGFYVF